METLSQIMGMIQQRRQPEAQVLSRQLYDLVPQGSDVMSPEWKPHNDAYRYSLAVADGNQGLAQHFRRTASPEGLQLADLMNARLGAANDAPNLAIGLRHLMARRGMLDANGQPTEQGLAFIRSLQTGGYGQ